MANAPGARALIENAPVHGDVMVPSLASVKSDKPEFYAAGCFAQREEDKATGLRFGSLEGHFRMALVGNSHAGQWFPALMAVARQRGWRLTVYTKPSCAFVPIMLGKKHPYEECYRWGRRPPGKALRNASRSRDRGSQHSGGRIWLTLTRPIALGASHWRSGSFWATLGKRWNTSGGHSRYADHAV